MIIIRRATVERTLMLLNYGPDKLILGHSPKGYINIDLFEQWMLQVFEPSVQEIRAHWGYSGPGLIIADGCTAHKTPIFEEVCQRLKLEIFWLPAHSSNQLQVLDLGVFAVHKSIVKKQNIAELKEESELVKLIVTLLDAWYSCCTPGNLNGAWRAMGAVYKFTDEQTIRITFDKSSAIKLLGRELSRKERAALNEQNMCGERKRISAQDFNEYFREKYPDLYAPSLFGVGIRNDQKIDVDNFQENSLSTETSEEDNDDEDLDPLVVEFQSEIFDLSNVPCRDFEHCPERQISYPTSKLRQETERTVETHSSLKNHFDLIKQIHNSSPFQPKPEKPLIKKQKNTFGNSLFFHIK